MEQPIDVEKRLTDLEVKASFTEDLVDHLNQIVANQQHQIDLLLLEVGRLREQGSSGDSEVLRSLRDELPPHY
jgi:SlyX protein